MKYVNVWVKKIFPKVNKFSESLWLTQLFIFLQMSCSRASQLFFKKITKEVEGILGVNGRKLDILRPVCRKCTCFNDTLVNTLLYKDSNFFQRPTIHWSSAKRSWNSSPHFYASSYILDSCNNWKESRFSIWIYIHFFRISPWKSFLCAAKEVQKSGTENVTKKSIDFIFYIKELKFPIVDFMGFSNWLNMC